MPARTITVAQQKGGAGKTTVVAQLAVALAERNFAVACVDIDPQGSLSTWAELRGDANGKFRPITQEAIAGWRLSSGLADLQRRHDFVLIDSPPHAETEARVAIRVADMVLIPCQPSLLDFWASHATLELAKKEKRGSVVVLNRVPPRGRVIDDVRRAMTEAGVVPTAATLGNRSAFAASMHRGRGVVEIEPRGRAAAEIRELAAALVP